MLASQPLGPESWRVIPLFLLLFIGMWVMVSFIISKVGWNTFATRYPARSKPAGKSFTSSRTWFGTYLAGYRNVVRVIFTDAGVYFYTAYLFRAFHSPFLVPWDKVKRIEKYKVFFGFQYDLDINDGLGEIHAVLPASAEHDLRKYANSILPTPG